jgi:hypothetical protein
MKDEPENAEWPASGAAGPPGMPVLADRATFQAELDALRLREKAHPRRGCDRGGPPTAADGGMRKVIEYTLVSADGVFEDPANLGFMEYRDDAYRRDGLGLLTACDAMLFGRSAHRSCPRRQAPSVAFSAPVRGLHGPEIRRPRTHSGRRQPEFPPRSTYALVSGG